MATTPNPHYTLSGRLTDRQGEPLQDLSVRAFDQDPNTPDNPLGQAVTDAAGRYSIRFAAEQFRIGGRESGGPDVFIRVYHGEELLGESPVRRNAKSRITINLQMSFVRADLTPEPAFTVGGAVRRADGRPVSGMLVRAHDQGLRRRSPLGEAHTDADGRYSIGYDQDGLLDPARGSANLLVEAHSANGERLAISEVHFNARRHEIIDLTVQTDTRQSEWQRLEAQLQPALEGTSLAELTDTDVTFLEKTTRLPAMPLQLRRHAARAAARSKLPEWFHYAMLRQGLPGELEGLLDQPLPKVREALAAAQQTNVVAAPTDQEMAALWQGFEALQTEHVLDRPASGRQLRLRQLCEVAGLTRDAQQIMAGALASQDRQTPDVWTALRQETGLDHRSVERLELALRTADLTSDHLGLMTALQRDSRLHTLRDLAKHYDLETWKAVVQRTVAEDASGLPADVPGASADERRTNFARRLYSQVAAAYPDVAVIYGLSRRPALAARPAVRLLPQVLEADASFDLTSVRLDAYVKAHKTELGIQTDAEEEALREDLKRVQRVYRLRSEPEAVAQLLEDGLDSSVAVVRRGREHFLARYGTDEALGREAAQTIYARAEENAAKAFAVYARFSPSLHSRRPSAAAGDCPDQLAGVPNYANLFGTLDGCTCEPCESVYSPAAYLTDLLAFLQHEVRPPPDATDTGDGLQALQERSFCDRHGQLLPNKPRRPDILDLKLSCRNADTLVPYVDLVLEIFENALSPRPDGSPQTTLGAEQLAAQPEHVIPEAYGKLAEAIFPFTLPFDLWQEEAAIYLRELGTSRMELLETFFPCATPQDGEPQDLTAIHRWQDSGIAAARLGLSEAQWQLISDQSMDRVRAAWGNLPGSDESWWRPLRVVDAFLERSGLGYSDLLRLLALKSVNPQGRLALDPKDLASCDPKQMHIDGLDATALAFMHRFLRLQRALGWSLRELDRALVGLSPGLHQGRPTLNAACLVRLSHVARLHERFGLPLIEVLSWWSPLDTADDDAPHLPPSRPFYDTLFLSGRAGEAEFEAFRLNTARTELRDATKPLTAQLSAISGVLRLSQADLQRLIEATCGDTAPRLNLANLSLLHRHASLTRALRLSIADYLALQTLIGFDPFIAAGDLDHTVQTLRFVERAQALRDSGMTVVEVDYVLRQTTPFATGRTVAPTEAWVQTALTALRDSLQPVATLEDAAQQALSVGLSAVLGLPAATCTALLAHIPSPADATVTAGQALLNALRTGTAASAETASVGTDEALAALLYRLHKTALLIDKLGITHQELPLLLAKSPAVGWLDLQTLPVRHGDDALPFDGWMRLVQLFYFRDTLPPEQRGQLFSLFAMADQFIAGGTADVALARQAYIARLTTLSGWPEADIAALIGPSNVSGAAPAGAGILQGHFPVHFRDERVLRHLQAAVTLLRRLGVTAAEAAGWVSPTQNDEQREQPIAQIKNALRARYGERWGEVGKALRDPLRERQRRALVAHLKQEWGLERADELFDHFLIDVEMSPCMLTSRLIQATASVQLFVQRVLLNLEPGLALSDEAAEQWEWMKNYRVWEANRRVFLYPENWIEPALRDDKTPFFMELEQELMQADITNDSAETALRHYLEKLHKVARLQVCGQYLESADGDRPAILHVFARSRDLPHHYYYRRGVLEVEMPAPHATWKTDGALEAAWTPWERVDVEIEGDHLIPVVYNRRLYLFWPIFSSEDEAPLTHLTQQALELFRQMLMLQTQIGDLVRALFQGVGTAVVAGMTNSIIQLLGSLEQAFPIDLEALQNNVRNIRKHLLTAVGVTESWSIATYPNTTSQERKEKFDSTWRIMNQLDLPNLDTVAAIFASIGELVSSFEGHLIKLLPAKRLEVHLAWSEYRYDCWSAKKTSAGAVTFRDVVSTFFESLPELPGLGNGGVKRLFTFRGEVNQRNQLTIHCHVALPRSVNTGTPGAPSYTYTLAQPLEIGQFRLNGCSAKLDTFDTEETLTVVDLVQQGFDQVTQQAQTALSLLSGDRQLNQRGEPITPDDDPNRPSQLRHWLEYGLSLPAFDLTLGPLPRHFIHLQGQDHYRILARHQDGQDITKLLGFFYQDAGRSFFCFPWRLPENNPGKRAEGLGYVFLPFYHPYTCALLENIQRQGIAGVYDSRYVRRADGYLDPDTAGEPLQMVLRDDDYFRPSEYEPIDYVYNPPDGDRALRPVENIDFSTIGAYAQYNWEIFFHIPLLIATRLSTNQKFHQAQQWFHYIFNPTDRSPGEVPAKYWRTLPFVETSAQGYEQQQIDALLRMLAEEAEVPGLQEIERAVRRWRRDAFNPHLVARSRTVAFQKAVVMKYIDNLIAWGDALFRRETREALNEATQLYVLAAQLLGPRPRRIPRAAQRQERSFRDLPALDAFSNALVELESLLPARGAGASGRQRALSAAGRVLSDQASLVRLDRAWQVLAKSHSLQHSGAITDAKEQGTTAHAEALYFCVPSNDALLSKWDVVADRLFKIRHCQNIEGRALRLPLLSPPLDPGILVQARAMGVDVDNLLSQPQAALPHYRFQVLAQKATELCAEVKSLGAALLSALEKRDGEAMALLRNTHESRLLAAVQTVKQQQIDEARRSLESLKRAQEAIALRRDHHQRLLTEFMNPEEVVHTVLGAASLLLQAGQFGAKFGAAVASLVPNVKFGFVTTLGGTYGGDNIGFGAERAADALGHLASILSSTGGLISTMGGFRRRAEDWQLQIHLAEKELEGLAQQLAAAEIRLAIAEADLQQHTLQMVQSQETQDFMQQKYTNQALYDWMVSRTATLYFQSYQLAYDLAQQCERAFGYELGVESPGLIRPGYWDNLKQGLLAGEHLHHDLKRLEVAYLDQHRRELELTKHVSLRQLDPLALIRLRETGRCSLRLPEEIFDLDYPGHYFRRLKSVSLTLPCVVGPYTNIACTLRLLTNSVRVNTADGDHGYPRNADSQGLPAADQRFIEQMVPVHAIAASHAQHDSGLFELSFRDERYLPFERAGVISDWSIELFNDGSPDFGKPLRQFDYGTIADVILHVSYTAREGSGAFKDRAIAHLRDYFSQDDATPSVRMINLRQEFPTQWRRFLHPTNPADGNVFELEASPQLFRLLDREKTLRIQTLWLLARCADAGNYEAVLTPPLPAPPPAPMLDPHRLTLTPTALYGGLHVSEKDVAALGIAIAPTDPPATWRLRLSRPGGGNLHIDPSNDAAEVEDVVLVLGYTWG